MFYLGNSTQVGISVLSVMGTGPGAGWMPNKYLFEGGRERQASKGDTWSEV